MTEQRVLTRTPVTDENRADLEVFRDFFYDVTYGEDYITGYGVQKGVKAVAGTTQIYGRNEPGVQYAPRDHQPDHGGEPRRRLRPPARGLTAPHRECVGAARLDRVDRAALRTRQAREAWTTNFLVSIDGLQ